MSIANNLINHFLSIGGVEVSQPQEVRGTKIVYLVINGENILTVGQGGPSRLKNLMRNSRCNSKHIKSFVVAASNAVHGPNHRYFFIECEESKDSRSLEKELHEKFCNVHIEGCDSIRLVDVNLFLWGKISEKIADSITPGFGAVMELVIQDADAFYGVYKLPKYHDLLELAFGGYFRPPSNME